MIAIPLWANRDLAKRYKITRRQVDILAGIAKGLTNTEIGLALHLSEDTVKTHAKGLFARLSVTNRAAAVAHAYDVGILRTRAARSAAAHADRLETQRIAATSALVRRSA